MTNEQALLESRKLWFAAQGGKNVDNDIEKLVSQLTEEQFELVMSKRDEYHEDTTSVELSRYDAVAHTPKVLPKFKSITVCDPGQQTLSLMARKAGIL